MQDTNSNLDRLRDAVQRVNGILREPDIIDALLDQAVAMSGARAAVLRLLSPDGDELLQAGARGLSDAYLTKGPVRVADSGMDQRILDGKSVIISDVTQDKNIQYPKGAATEGHQGLYLRSGQLLNVVVALLVFIELLVSVRTGG